MRPQRGDIIFSVRAYGAYFHYGIFIGNNSVIHYRSKDDGFFNALIIKTSYADFAKGCPVYVEPREVGANSNEQTAKNAEKYLGSGLKEYNLAINNCEHFVNLCRYNEKKSCQVRDVVFKLGQIALNYLPLFGPLPLPNAITNI